MCLFHFSEGLTVPRFEPRPRPADELAGYYVSTEPVAPLTVEPVGDLLGNLIASGVDLRITPSLWPLHDALVGATLDFSMIRLQNAAPRDANNR